MLSINQSFTVFDVRGTRLPKGFVCDLSLRVSVISLHLSRISFICVMPAEGKTQFIDTSDNNNFVTALKLVLRSIKILRSVATLC